MLSEDVKEKMAEYLVDRIEELNATILEEIGNTLRYMGTLTPSQAYKIIQDLKYGGSYQKIIKKLAEVSKLNEKQIYKIFEEIAKDDQNFAKQFYKFRKIDFIPYNRNKELKDQVKAIAKITANQYVNLMKTSAFMTIRNGKKVYTPLSKVYQETLDKAVLEIAQGKESYQQAINRTIQELAESGIQTVDYESGYHKRLDSAVRMNVLDGIRDLSNTLQQQFGEEYKADGVEISVHMNPAPDHADIQGRQFSNKKENGKPSDWERLQNGERVKDYSGVYRQLEHSKNGGYRPISEYNCYHYIFSIVLGVSKPEYSQKQLDEINKKNTDGFDFEGKHYTLYEGTQLQRQIETKIRKLKDKHIGAVAVGDMDEAGNCQRKIGQLSSKYNQLAKASGLSTKYDRTQVKGYKEIKNMI